MSPKTMKIPSRYEPLTAVLVFVFILLSAHFFWKFTVLGDESDLQVTFFGWDISVPFNLMADHVAQMVSRIMHLIGFTHQLEPYNIIRHDNGAAIRVVWACTGFKQSYIFITLILFFKGPWQKKLWFIPLGLIVIYLFNIFRISFLAGMVRFHPEWFDLVHEEIFKYLFYGLIFGLWVIWEEKIRKDIHLNKLLSRLIAEQMKEWPMAGKFYSSLKDVKTRSFDMGEFHVQVQFNPARAVSTNARVDPKSISERPCFLCSHNRPAEQKGIEVGNYTILVNPFPIFPEHFTIVRNEHVPQLILPYFIEFLSFARMMDNYVIFYNGAKCGASAPDHAHFQAGSKNFLPLVSDYFRLKNKHAELLQKNEDQELYLLHGYLRKVYCIESVDPESAKWIFRKLYKQLKEDSNEEPMMNVLSVYQQGKYYTFVLPRKASRPAQFFETGEKQLLISPAAVEMSGVLITPVEDHFNKITREDIESIYEQTGM